MDGTGSRSCLVARFGIIGVEPSVSDTRNLFMRSVLTWQEILNLKTCLYSMNPVGISYSGNCVQKWATKLFNY